MKARPLITKLKIKASTHCHLLTVNQCTFCSCSRCISGISQSMTTCSQHWGTSKHGEHWRNSSVRLVSVLVSRGAYLRFILMPCLFQPPSTLQHQSFSLHLCAVPPTGCSVLSTRRCGLVLPWALEVPVPVLDIPQRLTHIKAILFLIDTNSINPWSPCGGVRTDTVLHCSVCFPSARRK